MVHELNRIARCHSLDPAALAAALDAQQPGLAAQVRERNPHLFADQPVFVGAAQLDAIAAVAAALQRVSRLPDWVALALRDAPVTAQHAATHPGLFLGLDFHVEGDAIGLIEINTNPGGALLSALLARAQRACAPELSALAPGADAADAFERELLQMFADESQAAGCSAPLRRVAIVDTDPQQQYLAAEFLLFGRLFERAGIDAVVADPRQLRCDGGRLLVQQPGGDALPVDLVYNRLTDFALLQPEHAALREAWEQDLAVIAPHPRAHALLADKRLLTRLCDRDALLALGATAADAALLAASVPRTVAVDPAHADALWAQRRELFFKPRAGYGSRATYRGAKLTRGVWQDIVAGDYVAQQLMPPGSRQLHDADAPMKYDLRAYAYGGRVLWMSARLYQGQTTNFRTPGGGFAPVYRVERADAGCQPRPMP